MKKNNLVENIATILIIIGISIIALHYIWDNSPININIGMVLNGVGLIILSVRRRNRESADKNINR